jgi:hypothetical protein
MFAHNDNTVHTMFTHDTNYTMFTHSDNTVHIRFTHDTDYTMFTHNDNTGHTMFRHSLLIAFMDSDILAYWVAIYLEATI